MPSENTPENTPPSPSLLSEILSKNQTDITPDGVTSESIPGSSDPGISTTPPSIKKPKEPISFAVFAKLIGSLFFVAIIFLGSFLAYIVFNPDQAVFFAQMFSINLVDIKAWLSLLVNWSFGTILFILSIIWIVSLFRAIWTPKELKRKRLLWFLIATAIGILLFGILAFWGYLFQIIDATPYDNPEGKVLIYDQSLYSHEDTKWEAQIINTNNMIGPITVFFDLRTNAELLKKTKLFQIESYSINFDGGRCWNGEQTVKGSNPAQEQSIVCTFDQIKSYNISGTYIGKNNLGETESIEIKIPPIEIRGLVNIRTQKDIKNNTIITLDASTLKSLGTPKWYYPESKRETTETQVTESISQTPKYLCLKVFGDACDRIFILENSDTKYLEGSIISEQDTVNPLQYVLSFTGVNIPQNQITKIEWQINDGEIICKDSDMICIYTFMRYGVNKVRVIFQVATGERKEIDTEINVKEPLGLERHLRVINSLGVVLNESSSTYQQDLRAYMLSDNIAPPETLTLDARDVISKNPGYVLDDVRWTIMGGGKTTELAGQRVTFTLNEPLRYTIQADYVFKNQTNIPGAVSEKASDTVIIDIERKGLIPRLTISATSDYVPVLVSFDASRSETADGEIKKFIFDFGDGKPPIEGDSIQEYQYSTPGEKQITLTVIKNNGEKATLKRTLVLKDQARTLGWSSSITPGVPATTIDFEARGTTGQVEEYIWNFGDNTPLSYGYITTHTFEKSGSYDITLTVRYADGTQKNEKRSYEVVDISE